MKRSWSHTALLAVDAFVAATAVLGGLALAAGLEGDRFPQAWLEGTPFQSYVLPGLILSAVVGGSAAVATARTLGGTRTGGRASTLAGLVLIAWMTGEILLLNDTAWVSPMEGVYLVLGLVMIGLGLALGVGRRAPAETTEKAEPPAPVGR